MFKKLFLITVLMYGSLNCAMPLTNNYSGHLSVEAYLYRDLVHEYITIVKEYYKARTIKSETNHTEIYDYTINSLKLLLDVVDLYSDEIGVQNSNKLKSIIQTKIRKLWWE
jgi:hypothetical protein